MLFEVCRISWFMSATVVLFLSSSSVPVADFWAEKLKKKTLSSAGVGKIFFHQGFCWTQRLVAAQTELVGIPNNFFGRHKNSSTLFTPPPIFFPVIFWGGVWCFFHRRMFGFFRICCHTLFMGENIDLPALRKRTNDDRWKTNAFFLNRAGYIDSFMVVLVFPAMVMLVFFLGGKRYMKVKKKKSTFFFKVQQDYPPPQFTKHSCW